MNMRYTNHNHGKAAASPTNPRIMTIKPITPTQ